MSERSAAKHDKDGGEICDPTPMQPPVGYKKSLTLSEQIQQQVRVMQLRMLEDARLEETEDEADDFNVGDDFEPLSKYENDHMPTLANLKKRAKEINDQIEKRKLELAIANTKDRIDKTNRKAGSPLAPTEEKETPETE